MFAKNADIDIDIDEDLNEEPQTIARGLVVMYGGRGHTVSYDVPTFMDDYIYQIERMEFRHPLPRDGVFMCEFELVGSFKYDPGVDDVDCHLSVKSFRPATQEEWGHHIDGEWPWDPKDEAQPNTPTK